MRNNTRNASTSCAYGQSSILPLASCLQRYPLISSDVFSLSLTRFVVSIKNAARFRHYATALGWNPEARSCSSYMLQKASASMSVLPAGHSRVVGKSDIKLTRNQGRE
jgi:hypothetical protein